MRARLLISTIIMAIVFAPSAFAAGNTPSKSVYNHKSSQVQKAVAGAVKNTTTHKPATKPATKPVATTKTSGTLPFTGLDLGLFGAVGIVLVVMGYGLRRVGKKPPANLG
jgi:hypothetical protein